MKLLLCLISDQHVPNLLSVHAVKPNLLLLVVSEKMKKDGVASNFLNALDLSDSYKNSALKHDIVDLKEENSIIATMNVLKTEFSKYPEAEWFVNITGGTKPMSIGAYEFFKDKDAHMLYIPIVSQSKAIDFSNGQSLELTYQLPIREFLAGYGFDFIKEENKVLEGETRAKKLFEFSIYLSEHYEFAHKMMKTLDLMIQEVYGGEKDKARNKARKKGIYLSNFGVQDQRLIDYLAYNFKLDDDGVSLSGKLSPHAVQFLTGNWLEVFVWGILSKYSEKLNIWDVRLGLLPGKKVDEETQKKEIKNDWDIAFMYGQALRFVECKTGDQEHDPSGNETLYKIEAIKKQLGALNVKSYLATTAPNILEGDKIRDPIVTRAKLYNCTIIPGSDIRDLAELERKKDPSIVQRISKEFFPKQEAHS